MLTSSKEVFNPGGLSVLYVDHKKRGIQPSRIEIYDTSKTSFWDAVQIVMLLQEIFMHPKFLAPKNVFVAKNVSGTLFFVS